MLLTPRTRQEYQEAFEQELARLNGPQRQAVDQLEGPVLVIAGPGTGKTHILAARIGRILLETDTQPGNILCLTFTDAGVLAMRERLLQFIGPEAHRVHIYTFHSFCNTVIQDNLELFGRQELEPISELERVELIRALLEALPGDHPLRSGQIDSYFYERHLHELFQSMKRENWSVDQVLAELDAYLESLPERPEFQYQRRHGEHVAGDLKTARIAEETVRMEKLRAAAELFPLYEAAKSQAHRYDYDDMIQWVLRAFAEHEFLLRTYQEQYLYLLVDEYQDTNGAQNEIIHQLISYWDIPNIFIVGDDDQSIYEFQGARLKHLSDFFFTYRDQVSLVVLTDNYRSNQAILDAAAGLIRENELRIGRHLAEEGIDKQLTAAHPARQQAVLPQLVEFPTRLHEEVALVEQIRQLHREGVGYANIAVIYAQHRQARSLVALFDKRGIPYQTRRSVDVLQLPLIRRVRRILEYLREELTRPHSGEALLFQVLHYDFWQIPLADLATLSLQRHTLPAQDDEGPRQWRTLLARPVAELAALGLAAPDKIAQAGHLLEDLLRAGANQPVPLLLERLFNRSGLLAQVLDHPDRHQQVPALYTLLSFAEEEAERRPDLTLPDFLDTLERMESNRLSLPLAQQSMLDEGVQLLTAHSAKGLEFDYVFVLDATKDYWEPRDRRNSYRFSLPPTLTYSGEADALEARRRLFYVAMTRARQVLQVSYARADARQKLLQRVRFIDEIQAETGLPITLQEVAASLLEEAQLLRLTEQQFPEITPLAPQLIDQMLRDFRMSISALNRYLDCPLRFYYEYILRVPRLPGAAARYGIAMHQAIQRLFERMLLSRPRSFPGEADFLRFFEQAFQRTAGLLPAAQYEQLREQGRRHLKRYYQQYYGTWNQRVQVEYTIRQVEWQGIPLTGTLDKLEFLPQQEAVIVDYKTGKADRAHFRSPTSTNPYGGIYWRQLLFYKILYDAFDRTGRLARRGTITFLDPDAQGVFPEFTLEYTPDDVETVRTAIREVYTKIQAHDFYTGCGKPTCQWCTFLRQEVLPDSLADADLEGLDDPS
ncbi:MAG: ATP-dependent helicase [Lewinellaceae bacterium]|nr:ATP-dependent helicase [Lewinellaceae bacterium]